MAVRSERELDAAMPEPLAHNLRMYVLDEEDGRMAVAEVMEPVTDVERVQRAGSKRSCGPLG